MKHHFIAGICLAVLSVVSFISCAEPSVPLDPLPTGQETSEGWLLWSPPEVIVLVVDDAQTPEAEELRSNVAGILQKGLESAHNELHWGSCSGHDPAQWHPADIRIVLARPSAPDEESLYTSVQAKDLTWVTTMSAKEQIPPIVLAAETGLTDRLAQPGEVFRPLHAAKRTLEILSGVRAPETPDEAAFVATLPPDAYARVIVATTRDDEDAYPVDDFYLDEATRAKVRRTTAYGPYNQKYGDCADVQLAGAPRIATWTNTIDYASFYSFPCQSDFELESMLSYCCADCGPRCHDRPLSVSEDGVAACRIFIEQDNLDTCDPERGWRDPDGKPELTTEHGVTLRRCEIVQHEGDLLDACQHSLECAGCGGGFCVTEVPELDKSDYCGALHAWNIRFTGGALEAGRAFFSMTCTTN